MSFCQEEKRIENESHSEEICAGRNDGGGVDRRNDWRKLLKQWW